MVICYVCNIILFIAVFSPMENVSAACGINALPVFAVQLLHRWHPYGCGSLFVFFDVPTDAPLMSINALVVSLWSAMS